MHEKRIINERSNFWELNLGQLFVLSSSKYGGDIVVWLRETIEEYPLIICQHGVLDFS